MAYLLPVLFCAIAAFLFVLVAVYVRGARRAHAAIDAELSRRGIHVQGLGMNGAPLPATPSVFGAPERGIVLTRRDGIRASLSPHPAQGAAALPGFGPVAPLHTLVEMPTDLPDQMICAHERAQAVFGAFPPSPQHTGNARFDARFGIFAPPVGAAGYHADPIPWVRTPSATTLFTNFDVLGFTALHVHAGRARMLFAPQAVDGLVAALDTGASLARPHEACPPAQPPSRLMMNSAKGIALLLVAMLVPMVLGSSMVPRLTGMGFEIAGSTVACPQGGSFHYSYRPNRMSTCTHASGTYAADRTAYALWQFALWAPYVLMATAASVGLYFKLRRDTARVVLRNLAP
ncbi:hypothetical protein [Pendulispora albinea]|uniref:Uncharacterized protein n=1 Tax=Pendulispora albinea TaxID=2741071 RepID=A0ABZ2MAP0_9BACT